jgi:hypothetical protein
MARPGSQGARGARPRSEAARASAAPRPAASGQVDDSSPFAPSQRPGDVAVD